MNYILFDGPVRNALLPFTFTRPVADIRIGILTIREKWENYLGSTTTTLTEEYLQEKFPMVELEENVMISASFLPNAVLAEMVSNLEVNQAIFKGDEVIAFYTQESQEEVDFETYEILEFNEECLTVEHTWDIFQKNDASIREDFELLTEDRTSQPIPKSVNVIAPENIFRLKIYKLSLKNIKPFKVYQEKKVDIKNITIQNPEISVYYTKLKNQFQNYKQRQGFYTIIAPQSGQVVQTLKAGLGETVKDGEPLMQIVPDDFDAAVEMSVSPLDMPLIALGQKVQLQFDGFPAIVFSGWPEASYGVFDGKVAAIDQSIDVNGNFKVWVKPNGGKAWPKDLRYGAGAKSIALLKDVPLIYELWRQLNGFPPEYYQQKAKAPSSKK